MQQVAEGYYRSLSKGIPDGKWDVIVIGSGIGGMGCAAALAKQGKRCLILEQHYVPGGFTHTFTRKGYSWDVGVHCVGEMSERDIPGQILSWLTDGELKWQHMGAKYEHFYYPDGFEIDFPSNYDGFRRALEEKFPKEREGIALYFKTVKEAVKEAKPYFGMKMLPEWAGRAGTQVMRAINRKDYWTRTTRDVLREIIPNPKLRAVLVGQWGYYGSTPSESCFAIHAMVVAHFMRGGYYPVGGSAAIANGLLKTVKAAGGETIVRAPVAEILVQGGKAVGVKLEGGGQEILAERVVSAAGARITAEDLVPGEWKETPWARAIREIPPSPPHLSLYLGIEGDIRAAGGTLGNQWFCETWDMERRDWEVQDPGSEAPMLFMSFPTLKDPTHDPGPTQRHTAEVVTFVPWKAFEKWKGTRRGHRDPEYMVFKKSIEERLIAQLRSHVPRIMDLVKYHELSTPLSTVHFTRAIHGAIYGLEATPRRFKSPHLQTRTPIKNLYMAGADVTSLGVTGALVGGVLAAATIEPRLLPKLGRSTRGSVVPEELKGRPSGFASSPSPDA